MKPTIAQRIRQARLSKQLDQADLAAKIDIATRTVQRWEKGEQVPDSNYLMRIAKVTNVVAHWLLTGEGGMFMNMQQKPNVISLPTNRYKKVELVSLPLLASVPAGALSQRFHSDHADRYITVDDVRDPNAFAQVVTMVKSKMPVKTA